MSLNVFGEPMIACSSDPLTGYFRDGFCHCQDDDRARPCETAALDRSPIAGLAVQTDPGFRHPVRGDDGDL